MTQTLPPSVQSRIEHVETMLKDVKMSDTKRWHLHNALVNLAREAEGHHRSAGRIEGAARSMRYLLETLGGIKPPAGLDAMGPNEAFGWGKALAESALVLLAAQIEAGRLSLGPAAVSPQKLADVLPDFSDLSETEGEPA